MRPLTLAFILLFAAPTLANAQIHVGFSASGTLTRIGTDIYRVQMRGESWFIDRGSYPEMIDAQGALRPLSFNIFSKGIEVNPNPHTLLDVHTGSEWMHPDGNWVINPYGDILFDLQLASQTGRLFLPYLTYAEWEGHYVDDYFRDNRFLADLSPESQYGNVFADLPQGIGESVAIQVTPEPSSIASLALGMLLVGGLVLRRWG